MLRLKLETLKETVSSSQGYNTDVWAQGVTLQRRMADDFSNQRKFAIWKENPF